MTLQLAPAFRVAGVLPQVLLMPYWFAPAPASVMPVMVSAPLPVLVTWIVCAALVVPTDWVVPKDRLLGLNLTVGVAVPVPDTATVCGLPVALSVTLREAVTAAATLGL